MAWHRFKVKGKHYMTKRMRSLDIIARSDVSAKQKAISKKLLPPFICEEIEFAPPTKSLLEAAERADINVPVNASGEDVAALLERKDDIAAPAGLTAFAERWDIFFSQYIGNKALFNVIFKNLPADSKSAFFIFCVYRFLSGDKKINLDTHPYKDIFYKFAALADKDERLFRSITHYKGEHLCAFGNVSNLPVGYKAGSTRTIAYKRAVCYLQEEFDENYHPLTAPSADDTAASLVSAKVTTNTDIKVCKEKNTTKKTKPKQPDQSVFILLKTDKFIPTKAIELKNKVVKIPDLEQKAIADLPVYLPRQNYNNPVASYRQNPIAKHTRKFGCLGISITILIIFIIVVSLII